MWSCAGSFNTSSRVIDIHRERVSERGDEERVGEGDERRTRLDETERDREIVRGREGGREGDSHLRLPYFLVIIWRIPWEA